MGELAQPSRDQRQQARQLDLGQQRVPDLVQRLHLPQPVRRRLVQARVLDRHGRLGRKQGDELLVLLGELGAAGLLGQVQVPVGDAAQQNRDPEEGAHRRMVRREAHRALVLGEVGEQQRLVLRDQHAEDAAAARPLADRRLLLARRCRW